MLQKSLERCAELARQDRAELEERVARLEAENEQLRTQLFMPNSADLTAPHNKRTSLAPET